MEAAHKLNGHEAKDHSLVPQAVWLNKGVRYEKRPVKGEDGKPVAGLLNARITPLTMSVV